MNRTWSNAVLSWITRIVSILLVALNAYGWWNESQARQDPLSNGEVGGDWFWQWAVLTHLLPLILIILATVFGWSRPVYGLIGFGIFLILQILSVGSEWAYLPLVAGPSLVVSVLYLIGVLLPRRA